MSFWFLTWSKTCARSRESWGSGRKPQWPGAGTGDVQDAGVTIPGVGVGVGLGAGAGLSVVGGLGFDDLSLPHETKETAPTAERMMATLRVIWITRTSQ